ncbi:MAG: hypothetical protein IKW00_01575 [Clostridia bacterium]|nr:hypothetical protein [Clostridia bacterium]
MPLSFLNGKRILMLCADFFDYRNQLAHRLRDAGCTVDLYDERPSASFLTKALIRRGSRLIRPSLRRYYKNIISENKNKAYDCIFVVKGEALTGEVLALLRKAYPQAKFVLYLWDSIRNVPGCEERIPLFDRVLTFDPADAEKMHIAFRPMFYGQDFRCTSPENGKYAYDVSFVGTAHSIRPRTVKAVERFCQKENLRFFYYLYSPHPLVYWMNKLLNPSYKAVCKRDIHFTPLSGEELLCIYGQSRCVLDIEHPDQRGVTTRPLEMLKMQKKVITTSSSIDQMDFYDPRNILIIGTDAENLNRPFIFSDYVPPAEEIIARYSIDAFLSDVFSDLSFCQKEQR